MADVFSQWQALLPGYLHGLVISLSLAGCVVLIGYPFGLVLALIHLSKRRILRALSRVVIEIGRGVPALVTLYVVYYGFPQIGLRLESFLAATVALAFTTGGYTSVIFESAILSVDRGQQEAVTALGLPRVTGFVRVILPQAIRNVVVPLAGWSILVLQATSLAYTVAVPELLSRAYGEAAKTYSYTPPLVLVGITYSVVSLLFLAGLALLGRAARLRGSVHPNPGVRT